MKKETTRISINAFEETVKKTYKPTVVIQYNGLDITVKKHISLADMAQFVDLCVKSCFGENDSVYSPESKDFAVCSSIITFYTNLSLPQSFEKSYELIYASGIIEQIVEVIDKAQYKAIITAIDEKVDYIANSNIGQINKKVEELVNALNNVFEQMTQTFGGISSDDFQNVIKTISENKLDEEKLVKAYIDSKKDNDE